MSNEISEIITTYRKTLATEYPAGWRRDGKMSVRDFAAKLSEQVHPMSVSHQAVTLWCDGKSTPSINFILMLSIVATEQWAREFAGDVLAALRPELYQPAGEIGKRILGNGKEQPQPTAK